MFEKCDQFRDLRDLILWKRWDDWLEERAVVSVRRLLQVFTDKVIVMYVRTYVCTNVCISRSIPYIEIYIRSNKLKFTLGFDFYLKESFTLWFCYLFYLEIGILYEIEKKINWQL